MTRYTARLFEGGEQLLRLLYEEGPLSSHQVTEHLGKTQCSESRKLRELGLIRRSNMARHGYVWEITSSGRDWVKAHE